MTPLALDPGGHTGWAVPGETGLWIIAQPGDSMRPQAQRHGLWFSRLRDRIDATVSRHGVDVIIPERQLVVRGTGSLVTLGMRAVVLEFGWRRSLMVDEVEISTWQAWAKKHLGWVKRERKHGGDEMDAQAILLFWMEMRMGKVEAA